ncbi:MAG: PLDc N-terminal domain-containing protein [Caldilineaceae bacterium]|nr:PLDc N-terminal domain-containing protein [Caldilineaceae bacterium]
MSTNRKKKWSDLSGPAKTASILMGLVQFGLLVAALADIRRRPAEEINGSKAMWVGLAFVNTIGPIAYFVKGRKQLPAAEEPAA